MSEQLVIPTLSGTFDALASGPDDGRPVLLLHGFPECAYQWEHQLAALGAAGFRGVAFDQRGYSPGIRPAEVDAYAPDELVGDVTEGRRRTGLAALRPRRPRLGIGGGVDGCRRPSRPPAQPHRRLDPARRRLQRRAAGRYRPAEALGVFPAVSDPR